jgi:hypothetical protein
MLAFAMFLFASLRLQIASDKSENKCGDVERHGDS